MSSVNALSLPHWCCVPFPYSHQSLIWREWWAMRYFPKPCMRRWPWLDTVLSMKMMYHLLHDLLITGLIAHAHIILFTEPLQWFQALLVLILRGWWWNKPRMQIRNALCERSNICVTSFAAAFWEKRWWCDVNWGMLNTNSVWLMPRMISFNTFLVNVKARSE